LAVDAGGAVGSLVDERYAPDSGAPLGRGSRPAFT
jgi:hypothetical protein